MAAGGLGPERTPPQLQIHDSHQGKVRFQSEDDTKKVFLSFNLKKNQVEKSLKVPEKRHLEKADYVIICENSF